METQEFVRRLKKARALIARGWCQDSFRSGRSCCAAGALMESPGPCYVIDSNGSGFTSLVTFNDAYGRKKSEVLAMFDNSIAALEGK